jgi:dTDP-4-dehydrorhamnose 3,5-epimerase
VPAGYANGAMSLLPGTKIVYFSDASLEGSVDDDFRYPARYWDPWQVAER